MPSSPSAPSGFRSLGVHLDLLAGRENARGIVGGNVATTVSSGNVQLNVAAGSLDEDTAISLFAYDEYSPFLPSTSGITPLAEVTVDLASSTLNSSAALTFSNVAAAPGDTLVLVRVDRAAYDGVPRLQVVALADVITANGETRAVTRVDTGLFGVTLEGITHEGRYALLRLAGPIGFIKGLTTATGNPVRALVSTNTLPFIATSNAAGYYVIPGVPGSNTVTARVLGQSLIGTAQAIAIDGTPVTADIALQGTVSQASITPITGAIAVEVNEPLSLTSPVAIDPTTIQATNITLRRVPPAACSEPSPPTALNCAVTEVPLRFVLSGSGKQLSLIPLVPPTNPPAVPTPPALEFSTNYTLQVTGLLDTVGGLITAPTTTFRTKDDVKPVYNLKALTFSFPNADGLLTVSAPNGTFPPGTEILIINSGNGVVLGLTAGNDGQVTGTLPASSLDTLIVSVTDPYGNTVIYRQSQYVDPATGETAIGPGGGSIEGAGGVGLDIPEGALTDGGGEWKAKISLVPEAEYPALYPRDVLSKLLDTDLHAGHTLKIEANREATFSHEVDVRFPLPDFTRVPADQRPSKPQDAFYTVHRRLLACPDGTNTCAEASKIIVFDVIDEAKAQCKAVPSSTAPKAVPATCDPEDMEIVTASPPFVGLVGMALTTILFMSWAMPLLPADLGRPTRGLIRGKVSRQAHQTGKLTTVPVVGAVVSGVSPDEVDPATGEKKPLAYIEGGVRVTTDAAGSYAFWDKRYSGGPIEVVAFSGGATARGTGFEVLPGEPNTPRYKQEAVVNITFPTEAPPPPTPDIIVKLVRADNNSIDLRGIAAIGVPLKVGIKGSIPGQSITINGVEINGVNYSTRTDLTGRYDYILDSPFEPTIPGTYRLSGTALRPLGDPVSFGDTFRIVAAGGGVDTDNANPPRVIEARTAPKKNAKGVSVGSFVSLSFTEPVKTVLGNIEFTSPEGVVPFKISAVTADQTVIEDLATAPTAAVTSITLQPLQGLKFATRYTVRATSGIEDLDKDATNQPAPKPLPAYETSFETFGPETINPDSTDTYSTGGFVILKTDESTTGWALKHVFGTSTWNGAMLGYDASDPANLTQLSSTLISNRVIDITGEGTTVVVASGPNHRSHPGDLLVYDVTNSQAPQWVGATTLSTGALDGTPSRIKLRNEKVYAATWGKGIQIADVLQMKSGFAECCSTAYFSMVDALYRDGGSFNTGAVTTISVTDPNSTAKPWMRDISVIDVNGETIIAVASSIGLVLANEGQQRVTYRGFPSFGGRAITYAYAVENALIAGRSIALVAGIDAVGQNILVVVDISDPLNPAPIASMALATQGKGVADIEISDGKAYIGFDSPTAPQVEIVQIGDPTQPSSAGVVAGVGGRLQVVDGILYGASYGYATQGVLGGIRTAALDLTPIVSAGGAFGVSRLAKSLEEAKVRITVVPRSTEITKAELKLYENGTEKAIISLPTAATEYTFPRGSEFDANRRYSARLVVNGGTPGERESTARTMRPARFDLLDTQEANLPDQDPIDVIPVFQGVPTISLAFKTFLPLAGDGREATVFVEGAVSSAIAPIERVVVNERVVSVVQTGSGTDNRGPFTGTYQANVAVGPQTELVTAYAVDAANRVSTQSLLIEPTAVFGLIVSRTATLKTPLMPGSASASSFRVELIDKGNTAPTQTIEVSTGAEARTLKLTKQGEVYRSEPLVAVPENARLAASLAPAIRDKRLAARLGSFVQFKLGTVTGNAIPQGILFKGPQIAEFLDPGRGAGYDVEVGAPGTMGDTLSLSAKSLRADLSALDDASPYALVRQSPDPRSPAFNFYKGRLVPLMDGVGTDGNRHRVVPLGRLLAEAAGASVTLPVGTGADRVQWDTLDVHPSYAAGFFGLANIFVGNISLPRFWDVTQSATFYRGTTPLVGLSVGAFLDKRTFEVDDESGVTAVVRGNDAWQEASFPQTTDLDGKVRFRVRSMAVDENSKQPLSGVVLSLTDEVGIRAMALLGTGGALPQTVVADVTQKEGDAPKTTAIVGGYASAGGVPRRHSDWFKRVAEVLAARVIGDDPQMIAIWNSVRGQIEVGFTARQIYLTADQLDEYTRWFLIGAMAGVPRGAYGAFKDSVVGVFDLVGSAGALATILAPSSEEERLIRLIVEPALGPAGAPVAKILANPQFISEQREKLKKLGTGLWGAAQFLSRPEVQEQLTVSILGSIISSYEGEVGKLATSYLGMTEGSPGFRPLVFGYAVGAMAGYFAEFGVEIFGLTLVGEGIGAALPVMMKAVSKGGVLGARTAAALRSVARLANAGGEGGRLAKGFRMLIKFLDALGPNALGRWFTKLEAVEEGPERVLKLMIRYADEPDAVLRIEGLARGFSEDGARGFSATESPIEALVTIEKIADDVSYRGTQRLIAVSADKAEDFARTMGRIAELSKTSPELVEGFENIFRTVENVDELLAAFGRRGRQNPAQFDDALRELGRSARCAQ